MDLQIDGKRALVTGGSRGIGRQIARRLALEGATPVVCSRDRNRAEEAAAQLSEETGQRVMGAVVELRDPQSVKDMVTHVTAELGGVDILVNSGSSVSGYVAEDFENVTDEFISNAFDEKFLGSLRCAREVVPFMRDSGWGSIVNICGHSARVAGWIGAGARNAAMVALTKNLAVELGSSGIRVNAVHPSTTQTETLQDRMEALASWRGVAVEDQMKRVRAESALGRLVSAEEVANVAVFLGSPAAGGITGEVVAVTGGAGRSIHY